MTPSDMSEVSSGFTLTKPVLTYSSPVLLFLLLVLHMDYNKIRYGVEHDYLHYTHNDTEEFETFDEGLKYYLECITNPDEEFDDCFSLVLVNTDEEDNIIDDRFEEREYLLTKMYREYDGSND